jgi:hypothetical protein
MNRTVVRPVKLNQDEDRFLRAIAAERSTSISSVIRWAINAAARQEAARLEKVNKKSDRTAISDARAVAL